MNPHPTLRPLGRKLSLIAIVGSVAVAVGCGSIVEQPAAERQIARQVEGTFNIDVKRVKCPSDVDIETGATYRCEVVTRDGNRLDATIEIANEDADLRIRTLSG